MKIRVGIVGYGNLGKAAAENIKNFDDIELKAIISRRPDSIKNAPCEVVAYSQINQLKGKVDVMLMCGGSAHDLPTQSKEVANSFCLVDSFDAHANIPVHVKAVGDAAQKAKTLACVSVGWDPGVFSLMRTFFNAVLPVGTDYTFWGKGVSQGHSDALRHVEGVKKAVQYTIPKDDAVNAARSGSQPILSVKDKHLRECFVVAAENADQNKIKQDIINMPNYFAGYDTVVNFISESEFDKNHTSLPHGGFVLRSGKTDESTNHLLEFSLKLDSNPQFTSSVMLAYARAVYRLHSEGKSGCVTAFDIPYTYISQFSRDELLKSFL